MIPASNSARIAAWLEQVWLARYLDGLLSDEETAWFEAYALDKSELLAKIDADTALRDSLVAGASLRQSGIPGESDVEPIAAVRGTGTLAATKLAGSSLQRGHDRRRSTLRWISMAATVVLSAAAGWMGSRSLTPAADGPWIVVSPTRVIYETSRGEPSSPRVEHPDSTSRFVLIEIPVPPTATDIGLNLGTLQREPLTASPDGFVSFLVDRKFLRTSPPATVTYVLAGQTVQQAISFDAFRQRQQ